MVILKGVLGGRKGEGGGKVGEGREEEGGPEERRETKGKGGETGF